MSVPLPATLVIQRKSGRRGDFNVGELTNELGKFDVKDALIEEFDPGTYTGIGVMAKIEPECFTWKGRAFFRVRAILEAFYVDEVAQEESSAAPAPPPEPDPADQSVQSAAIDQALPASDRGAGVRSPAPRRERLESSAPSQAQSNKRPRVAANSDQPAPSSGSEQAHGPGSADDLDADQQLFGAELYELLIQRVPIKLDPTVDRMQFRAQRDRLKGLGYGFEPKAQTWKLAA